MKRLDVAVIGAGPAGAWTAGLLARRGARVAIVDGSHPREKPCGGGVTGRALALVDRAVDEALPAVTIRRARFVESAAGGGSTVVTLEDGASRSLIVASRARLDSVLLDGARRDGAQLVASRVTNLARDGSGWRIDTADGQRLISTALVGADGTNSLTRRRLAHPFRRDQLSVAAGFFAHGVTSEEILLEFTAEPPGYLWSFPRPDHLAIGVCAQADARVPSGLLRAKAAQWIEKAGIAPGARLEPYAWPIPSLSARDFARLEVTGPGWMLVGDAAGLVDPITREGIFFALQSASFAADALAANRSNAAEVSRAYRDRVMSEIVAELVRAARFKADFFRPRFLDVMLEGLRRSERIRRVMADLIAGEQCYRGLRTRLAATCEFGLAWKMLSGKSTRRAPERSHSAV